LALLLPLPARASFPGQNGRIAYQSVQDGNAEIYSVNPDGTNPTRLTNDPAPDGTPAWSRDGTKIVFTSARDNHNHIFSMNADGAGVTQLTFGSPSDEEPTWAPEGTHVAYRSVPITTDALMIMNADGTGQHSIRTSSTSSYSDRAPAWSPTGEPITFDIRNEPSSHEIWTISPDGSHLIRVTIDGSRPDWSPDGTRIVFDSQRAFAYRDKGLAIVNVQTGAETGIPNTTDLTDPVWSPDGTRVAATDGTYIYTLNPDGTDRRLVAEGTAPSWQALDPPPYPGQTYPRPRGATPMQVALVPEYLECNGSASNDTHGAPLAFPSCSPPQLGTWNLTMGTPDANGAGSRFIGSLVFRVVTGDVRVESYLTDVRCKSTVEPDPGTEGFPCRAGEMADYVGEIQGYPLVRITDMRNGWQANQPGTTANLRFPFAIPCVATASDSVGSTCSGSTTFNSVVPGAIQAGARSVWAIQRADVYDGGADGVASTQSNNGPFVTQGLFVP